MKWGYVLGTTILVLMIVRFQWTVVEGGAKREKAVLVIFLCLGWLVAMVLIFYPHAKGPTEFIEFLFEPLGRVLE